MYITHTHFHFVILVSIMLRQANIKLNKQCLCLHKTKKIQSSDMHTTHTHTFTHMKMVLHVTWYKKTAIILCHPSVTSQNNFSNENEFEYTVITRLLLSCQEY